MGAPGLFGRRTGVNSSPATVTVGRMNDSRPRSVDTIPEPSATVVTSLNPTQRPAARDSS